MQKVQTMTSLRVGLFLCALVLTSAPCLAGSAAVLLFPSSVVLDKDNSSGRLSLMNKGDARGVYQLEWLDLSMNSDGRLEKQNAVPDWSLKPHVRISPRRVNLGPGETQIIKIALKRNSGAAEGEYYAHLRTLLVVDNVEEKLIETSETDGTPFTVKARSGMAIPIIWRNTAQQPNASFSQVSFEADNRLNIDVQRQGPLSTRGTVQAFLVKADGTQSPVSDPAALIIYPSVQTKNLSLNLNLDLDSSVYRNQQLKLQYLVENTTSNELITETVLPLSSIPKYAGY